MHHLPMLAHFALWFACNLYLWSMKQSQLAAYGVHGDGSYRISRVLLVREEALMSMYVWAILMLAAFGGVVGWVVMR
jgi:hypothetical protein